MNTGIEILLKRMADCPEDFYYDPSKGESRWARLVDNAIAGEIATQEERELLDAGMKEVRRQKFTETVMRELAGVDETSEDPKSLEDVIKQYRATGISSVGQTQVSSTGQSQYSNTSGLYPNGVGGSVTWENREPLGHALDAVKYQNEMMRRHLDEHRDALNKVEVRKKATLR